MTELYNQILDDATGRLQRAATADMASPDFNWDQLIELLLIEDSALQDVFSSKTLQLADLCKNAKNVYQSYIDLSAQDVEEGEE